MAGRTGLCDRCKTEDEIRYHDGEWLCSGCEMDMQEGVNEREE